MEDQNSGNINSISIPVTQQQSVEQNSLHLNPPNPPPQPPDPGDPD